MNDSFGQFIADCRAAEKKAEEKRPMMMLTKANRTALPELYAQEGKGDDAIAHVKFFCPWNQWTWYATEFDGEDTFFGLVIGHETEIGYFSLAELMSVRRGALTIERDRHFRPCTIRECREKHP
jgi:hypothetical protein